MAREKTRLGIGIYSVPEASRLSGVASQRIRRWLRGYHYDVRGAARESAPVIAAQFGED